MSYRGSTLIMSRVGPFSSPSKTLSSHVKSQAEVHSLPVEREPQILEGSVIDFDHWLDPGSPKVRKDLQDRYQLALDALLPTERED